MLRCELMALVVVMATVADYRAAAELSSSIDLSTLPYLTDPASGKLVIDPQDYMDFDNIYTPNDTYRRQQTAQGKNYHLIKAFDFANYFKSDYWKYSSEADLRLSAWPVANATRCAEQLDWLERQLNTSDSLFASGEQHVALMGLMDSFGRPPAASYVGRAHWLGSYYTCQRSVINMGAYESEATTNNNNSKQDDILKGRYCLAKVRDKDWPQRDNYEPKISYKVGVCLPETCETQSLERHRHQLERLIKFQLPDFYKRRLQVHDLYCLPDERSPVRRLSLPARLFLFVVGAWLALSLVATWLYALHQAQGRDLRRLSSLIVGQKADIDREDHEENNNNNGELMAKPALEGAQASGEEAATTTASSASSLANWLAERSRHPLLLKTLRVMSIRENVVAFQEAPAAVRQAEAAGEALRVNLNPLDAIKCLCCLMVVLGHIVFIHMQHLSNVEQAIEQSERAWPRLVIPFFNFVDTFFIISGLLTAYFVFKRFTATTFARPQSWLLITLVRLVRLTPVYALVFWFVKTLGVHLGDGPLWDYGTDRHSIKGLCMHDHWWKSLLYLGNWDTLQPLCILPAWSIIVDAQYSLLMPPILLLLFKRRRWAYASLLVLVVASTGNMTWELVRQRAVKHSDMARVRLHVYPMISRFAADFYNSAKNRLAPVAIGLVGGHLLHQYERGRIARWPWFMRGACFRIVLALHLFIFMLPTIGLWTDGPRSQHQPDMTIFVLSNATIKPLWSLINTILLLRLITDLPRSSPAARLMSHNIWHPLGKLCFASYLIHYEVILYLLKSRHEGLPEPTVQNMAREFALAFLISTALAYFIHILYEAPINGLIMLHLAPGGGHSKSTPISVSEAPESRQHQPAANNSKEGGAMELLAGARCEAGGA